MITKTALLNYVVELDEDIADLKQRLATLEKTVAGKPKKTKK